MKKEQINFKLDQIENDIKVVYQRIVKDFEDIKKTKGYSITYIYDTLRGTYRHIEEQLQWWEKAETELYAIMSVIEYKTDEYNRALDLLQMIANFKNDKIDF